MALPSFQTRHAVIRVERFAVFFSLVLPLVTASAVYDEINGGLSKLRNDDSDGVVVDNLIYDSPQKMSLFVETDTADNWASVFRERERGSNISSDTPVGSYYIVPRTELQAKKNRKLRTRKPRHAEIAHSSGIQEFTTNGGRTRAFLSFHAPPVKRITTSSSSSTSSEPSSHKSTVGSVNTDLQQRLSKMLDPSKSIVNIFVYESPSTSSKGRQPKANPRVHKVASSGTNTKQYRSVDNQNKAKHNTLENQLKGIGKYPNIKKGELVFTKQVNRFSPLLQHLMSEQNDIQESTLLGHQTVDVHQTKKQPNVVHQQHQSQQHATNSALPHSFQRGHGQQNRFNFKIQPHSNNQFNRVNSFHNIRSLSISNSRTNSLANNQIYNSQSPSPGTTSHSTSNIFFNSYPGFSTIKNPLQIPLSTPVYIPGPSFSSNKRSLVPRFQDSFISRSFQTNNQPHQILRPAVQDSFAEATNHGNQFPSSHLKQSGRSFPDDASSCGMCEHLDDVTGACVFDPCCPLRLAGFGRVAC